MEPYKVGAYRLQVVKVEEVTLPVVSIALSFQGLTSFLVRVLYYKAG